MHTTHSPRYAEMWALCQKKTVFILSRLLVRLVPFSLLQNYHHNGKSLIELCVYRRALICRWSIVAGFSLSIPSMMMLLLLLPLLLLLFGIFSMILYYTWICHVCFSSNWFAARDCSFQYLFNRSLTLGIGRGKHPNKWISNQENSLFCVISTFSL